MRKMISALLAGAAVLSMASMSAFAADGDLTANTLEMEKLKEGATIASDSSVHIPLKDTLIEGAQAALGENMFANPDYFKVDVKKKKGAKLVSKTSVVEKDRDKNIPGREVYLKVSIKELMDDSETKVELQVIIKPKSDAIKLFPALEGKTYTFEPNKFYVKNDEDTADKAYMAGDGGSTMLKPQKNEDNEIVWEDENREIVRLRFEGSSSTSKFYPKMSTSWNKQQYQKVIGNADAFTLDFVGRPSISSTSRATVEFYNPFYDRDEDRLLVANEDIVMYEEIDGQLVDISDQITARVNEDGDNVLVLRTRYLGKYVITDGTAKVDTGEIEQDEQAEQEKTDGVPYEAEDGKDNPGTGF